MIIQKAVNVFNELCLCHKVAMQSHMSRSSVLQHFQKMRVPYFSHTLQVVEDNSIVVWELHVETK